MSSGLAGSEVAQLLSPGPLTADTITKQCAGMSQVLECWKASTCQDDLKRGDLWSLVTDSPQMINSRPEILSGIVPSSQRTDEKMVGFQKHLTGKAELTSLFSVFLDYAFAGLKEATGCVH